MEAIDPARAERALQAFVGQDVYLHLETTHGAYTRGGFGVFARNVRVRFDRAAVRGSGPYRAGLRTAGGWVYAEGLTHWQEEPDRVLLAGHDEEGRLTVVLEIGRQPFPMAVPGDQAEAASRAAEPAAAAGRAAGPGPEAAGPAAAPAVGASPGIPAAPAPEPVPAEAPEPVPAQASGLATGAVPPAGATVPAGTPAPAVAAVRPDDPVPAPGERHLLVVLAHPDDESFAAAGTMALAVRQGVPVTCVCATAGQLGRRVGQPPLATRESLGALRVRELREAMAAVGVTDVRVLGLWDKTVEFEDREELAARIAGIIRATGASTVITFHPELGGHPDHNAIGAATVAAVAGLPPAQRPRVLCPTGPARDRDPGLPVVVVPIAAVAHLKEAAFRAHRSQTGGWDQRMAREPELQQRFARLFREERFWVLPV